MGDWAFSRSTRWRWHREALITPIWEGPSNVQALDLLEAMQKKRAHEPFLAWLEERLAGWDALGADAARSAARRTLAELSAAEPEAAVWAAKAALARMADAAAVAALYALADRAGGRHRELAELYADRFLRGEPFSAAAARRTEVFLPGRGPS